MSDITSDFLWSDQARDIVDSVIQGMDGVGITPAVSQLATSLLPPDFQGLRPLLLELANGTARARSLGKAHDGWIYTSRMAEQSTHPDIATHHASRFGHGANIIEVCTGSGHDTLALSRRAASVVSFEADSRIARITGSNLAVTGIQNVVVRNEAWTNAVVFPDDVSGVWADPSRRNTDGRRTRSIEYHEPPVMDIVNWVKGAHQQAMLGIKLGPADEIPEDLTAITSSEFIGYRRECRERILWLHSSVPHTSVTLVDAQAQWVLAGSHLEDFEAELPTIRFLIEPHPAIIAAGGVSELFASAGVQPLDPHIAYGISDTLPEPSPFYERYTVLKWDKGISERRIGKRLRAFGWGRRTEFKKRGWSGDPESLRALIADPDASDAGVVLIARRDPGHVTLYAQRVQ